MGANTHHLGKTKQRRKRAWTAARQDAFLEALRDGYTVAGAAKKVGAYPKELYERRHRDPDFEAAWLDALEHGTDVLEDEVKRRGAEGWLEPVFHQGQVVGEVRKYSDTLLIFLLKKRRPEFRDRTAVELTGKNGGPVEVQHADAIDREIARLLAEMAAGGEAAASRKAAPPSVA